MKPLLELASIMRDDWDRRVQHDYRFWITNQISSELLLWAEGERDFAQIVSGVPSNLKGTALEIGSGVGRMLPAAARRFGSVIGVDISPKAIAKAKELQTAAGFKVAPAKLIASSGFDFSFVQGASVDFIWSFATVPHTPTRVFASYLCEIRRVLKVDGVARIQVFIGQQDDLVENDTLRIRAYSEECLKLAAQRAGLIVTEMSPVTMPLAELLDELDLKSVILTLTVGESVPAGFEEVAATLNPEGEVANGAVYPYSEFEAWLALNYADRLYQHGEIDRARSALEYVTSFCKTTGSELRETFERLSKVTASNEQRATIQVNIADGGLLRENLKVIQRRFPQLHTELLAVSHDELAKISVKPTPDGPVLWIGANCLDHPEKPILAGQVWVKRTLNEPRLANCPHIIVVGFGAGYHLESLLEGRQGELSCIETSPSALKRALEVRDLTKVLERLSSLSLAESSASSSLPSSVGSDAEVVVRPQSLAMSGNGVHSITKAFNGRRGRAELHPKIAVLGPLQGGTLPITGYTANALKNLGQAVRPIDLSPFNGGFELVGSLMRNDIRQNVCRQAYSEVISSILLETFSEKPIDILICMAQAPISPRALTELRRQGVITVLWFVEDYLRFTYWRETAKYFDYVFTIQKGECIEAIRQAGAANVHYLPVGCDPTIHIPSVLTPEERDRWGSAVSFVGAGYHNRRQVFAALNHLPFKIWGTEWPGAKPFDRMVQEDGRRLTPLEYIKIFNATDINLNLHSSNERDGVDPTGDFINPRTFELAASGVFQLVDERSLMGECFELGNEVITFSSVADLKEKINYYMQRPDERQMVAQRARARALRDHTYEKRLGEMLDTIYSHSYQKLRQRDQESPWAEMIRRADFDPELRKRCERAYSRGEEPALDGLIADITAGEGQLSDTEKKLLFLFHLRKQIIRMEHEGAGVRN